MEEGGPDFGYAFGSQPATPLWNPAFRPDTPGLTQQQSDHQPVEIADAGPQEEHTAAHRETSVPQVQDAAALSPSHTLREQDAESLSHDVSAPNLEGQQRQEDSFPQHLESELPASATTLESTAVRSAGVAPETTTSTGTTQVVAEPAEHTVEYTPLYPASTTHTASRSVEPLAESHAPSKLYEPQSEGTFLDEAVQEEASAPLMADDAAALDWGQPTDDFGLSATSQPLLDDTSFTPGAADASEPVKDAAIEAAEGKALELDWGAAVQDEALFGESIETDKKADGQLDWSGAAGDAFDIGQAGDSVPGGKAQEPDMSAWEAAFGDDELLDENAPKTSDGPAFFEDDGEGFLDDTPRPDTSATTGASSGSKYAPATPQAPQQTQGNAYAPQGSQFTDFSQLSRSASTPQTSLGGYQQGPAYGAARPQIKPAGDGKSFADKAKTGYASPYDLPDDISKTARRRPAGSGAARQSQPTPPAPPPRTSSYGFPQTGELSRTQTAGSLGQSRPPSSGSAYQPSHDSQSRKASLDRPPTASSAGASGFFADLPVTQRPKRESSGRYTPSQTPQPQQTSTFVPGPPQPVQAQPPPPNPYAQFRQPDRPAMFPEQPTVPAAGPPKLPSTQSIRYSPAPGSAPSAGMTVPTTAAPRYSPAPPPQTVGTPGSDRYASTQGGPPKPPVKPFAPRTSSPLAQFTTAQHQEQAAPETYKPLPTQPAGDYQQQDQDPNAFNQQAYQNGYTATPPMGAKPTITPPPQVPPPHTASPRKKSTYTPSGQLPLVPEAGVVPPVRSQSGSPGTRMRQGKLAITPYDRPASAYDQPSPTRANTSAANAFALPHRRGFSQELNFISPQDDRAHDPLQRWKGCPIFTWGPAGHIVSVFPVHAPRYGGGQTAPMIMSSPGVPKIQSVKDGFGSDEVLSSFPGPLKKGKKKEVITWLKNAINLMEKQSQMTSYQQAMPQDARRTEEKMLLWKTMLLLVENDGTLEGTPAVQDAVRALFDAEHRSAPPIGLAASEPSNALGLTQSSATSEAVNPRVVQSIREHLVKGEREKAAWMAVDERLWGHAMLISSTLTKDIWKQVIQEFVRKEVKSAGSGNESLAVLYEVFAGNWEESIDQLVPASARAGFQMMNRGDPTASQGDALAGLDKWRETLLLILSNRSTDDTQALLALGKLLAEYGRTEAAHTCYLFARQAIRFGGADDPQAHMTLVGADPRFQLDFGKDMESVMLSEVYEFAISMSAPAPATAPHLQSYKVYHALALTEAGLRDEARQYCDHIASFVSSKTKLSPYYNPYFLGMLDDLAKRLNQTPSSSAGIFSKPNMNKVSSSFFTKFNSFVAGDERDDASTASGQQEVGPFARVAGGTPPTISRTTSLQDMYGSYANGGPVGGAQSAGRYNPGSSANTYAPRSSMDHGRPQYSGQYAPQSARTSLESIRPGEAAHSPANSEYNPQNTHQPTQSSNYSPPQQRSYAPQMPRAASSQALTNVNGQYASSQAAQTPPSNNYTPSPYASTPEPEGAAPNPYQQRQPEPQLQDSDSFSYEPQAPAESEAASYRPIPAGSLKPVPTPSGYTYEAPTQASFDDEAPSYAPPTASYEAPSYQPYQPEADSTPQDVDDDAPKPKTKSYMDDDDDDDDLVKRAAALKLDNKSKADREADDAFKRAAEADGESFHMREYSGNASNADTLIANRPNAAGQRGSWFGGWFKKDPNAAPGPVKAKLGEESSFVYDPELKRWVDKKNPQATTAATATPPPPKGPMGGARAASGSQSPSAPPSAPPAGARAVSGPPLGSAPPRMPSGAGPPAFQPAGSGPPSRVGTPGSLAGEAMPVIAPTSQPPGSGPPSRPPTSMSNASSIDDLIGPAAGRKGTAKKKGRGGRYVDVMANKAI